MKMKKYKGISSLLPENISPVAMADALKMNINTLNSYLYGSRRPKPEAAAAIVSYLRANGCDVQLSDIYQVAS